MGFKEFRGVVDTEILDENLEENVSDELNEGVTFKGIANDLQRAIDLLLKNKDITDKTKGINLLKNIKKLADGA